MLCERCLKRNATVHLTVVVAGRQSMRHFCQSCTPAILPQPAEAEGLFGVTDVKVDGSQGATAGRQADVPRDSATATSLRTRIGLVGDFNPAVIAHQAIEKCFALAQTSRSLQVEPVWLPTERIVPGIRTVFAGLRGLWVVPASPYRNTEGALWAVQFARTTPVPFLGTCGGFQHALLEYAREVLGLAEVDHAESNPRTKVPLVTRLKCPLMEKREPVVAVGESRFKQAYRADSRLEGFQCAFGLNPDYEHLFSQGPLKVVARSPEGDVRAIELEGHPFFLGTLFQPERRALEGVLHPLVEAFFRACVEETA